MPSRRVRMPDGVELHAVMEGGEGDPALILLHGFPELGYSWRHQIGPLAQAGYRVVVPDLRGFGRSDVPQDVASYATDVLSRDVLTLLEEAGAERGVVIGHGWGGELAWKDAGR